MAYLATTDVARQAHFSLATLATDPSTLFPMARRRQQLRYGSAGGRFDPIMLARRLERFRADVDVEPKDVGQTIFPKQKPDNAVRSWYRLVRTGKLQLGAIEAVVDYLVAEALRKGKMPEGAKELPGFPFIEALDAARIARGK